MRLPRKFLRLSMFGGITVALAAAVVIAVFASGPAFASGARTFTAHQIRVQPHYKVANRLTGAATRFACQDVRTGQPLCYSPDQIRNAYAIQPLLNAGYTGKGRTIVIVDAYSNPYIESDLHIFDQTFGIPDPTFQIIAPYGQTPFDINDDTQVGWSGEISLDVLWAHAVAPQANIVLALAKTSDDTDIYQTTKYVIDNNIGDVISQSFGEAESCVDPNLMAQQHQMFENATSKGITLIASAGDDGAAQPSCDGSTLILSASSPADDPLVLAVGGTNLTADTTTGAYGSEHAWADNFSGCPAPSQGCSGGGFSNIYGRPSYQLGVLGTRQGHRGVPDVAYNAGVDGGVLTHWGVGLAAQGLDPTDPTTFFIFGGTSAGSPQWAGLTALADQMAHRRLGALNQAIYRMNRISSYYSSGFHDITSGTNSLDPITGYNAGRGWDPVTGWGTPKANKALPLIVSMSF